MIKYIFILITFIALTSCNGDSSYQKKIPGWYTMEQQLEAGKLSGEMTYYKNGKLKLAATFNAASVNSISLGITIVMKGTWEVENGFLKENKSMVEKNLQYLYYYYYKQSNNPLLGLLTIYYPIKSLQKNFASLRENITQKQFLVLCIKITNAKSPISKTSLYLHLFLCIVHSNR